jgi:MtrB/PioB family decaheme-associated outer membrane protein
MSRTIRSNSLAHAVAAALLAGAALPAAAATPAVDTSNWKCESCPFAKGYEADVSLGAQYADGANASFGRFTGIDRKKIYADVAASGTWRAEDGTFARYVLDDLGLDSRSGQIVFGRAGRYDVGLSYDGLPFRRFDTTVTPYAGRDVLTLPGGWVASGSTGGMTQLAAALGERDVRTERNTYGLEARYLAGSHWSLFADYQRQDKTGTGYTYAAFLTQAVQLPTPVDYTTDTVEAGVAWNTSTATARLAYSGSWFKDRYTSLTFDNPYLLLTPTAATGRLALAPDNDAQQVSLTGNWRLPAYYDTVLTYAASYGRLKQDETLLATSTDPAATAPASSLAGEVKLAHYSVGLSTVPVKGLSLRGSLRYDERRDTTPPQTIDYTVTDVFAGGTDTTPRYDYKRTRLDGSADYQLLRWFKIGGALQYDQVKRTEQDVAKTVEDGGYVRGRLTPWKSLSLTLKGGQYHREASGLDLTRLDPAENPLVRKYNLANRDRVFYEALVAWNATDKVMVSAQGKFANDAYRLSPLGLTDGRTRTFGATVTWAPTETLSLYVDGGYQKLKSKQLGQARPAGAGWELRNDDKFWNAGLGGSWAPVPRWTVTADLGYSKSTGDTRLLVAGAPDDYPAQKTKLDSERLGVRFQATPALGLHAKVLHEKLDESTWLLDGVGPDTVRTLLSMGAEADRHDVTLVAFTFDYRFGNVAPPAPKSE